MAYYNDINGSRSDKINYVSQIQNENICGGIRRICTLHFIYQLSDYKLVYWLINVNGEKIAGHQHIVVGVKGKKCQIYGEHLTFWYLGKYCRYHLVMPSVPRGAYE